MDPQSPASTATPGARKPARPLRWLAAGTVVLALALAAWVVAGPWLTVRGIERAIAERDAAALERYVDFPRLRANLKAQLDDRMVRAAGDKVAGNPFGAVALAVAGNATGVAVEALATPLGVGALLQGHTLWQRATGNTEGSGLSATALPARPLEGARHRYASSSRFVTTVAHANGHTTEFVLERQGLRWRLVDIRLPEDLSTLLH
jgi:hypothetical protein